MLEKAKFITIYLDDYVVMAYRELIDNIDEISEDILLTNLHRLLDEYPEGTLNEKNKGKYILKCDTFNNIKL